VCTAQKTQGQTCNTAASADCDQAGCRECATGNCADGYCCNMACSGACQTCSATAGTCTNLTDGTSCGASSSGDVCSAGTCCGSATPDYCGSSCTNTQTDPLNCGTCGKSCSGGLCSEGACFAGGSVVATLPGGGGVYDLATDGVNVYWVWNGTVYQCAVTGCGSSPLALASGQDAPETIATDGVSVYWGNAANSGMGSICSVHVGGGTVVTLATGGQPTEIALGASGSVYANGAPPGHASYVFWTDDGASELLGCPVAGCSPPSSPSIIASGLDTPIGIATDGSSIYFSSFDPTNGGIYSCALGLGACTPSAIATVQADPETVVADGNREYWPTRSGSSDALWSTSGELYSGTGAFEYMATDGVSLYANGFDGLIKCPVAGCGGAPTVLASGGGPRPALDNTYLYFVSDGRIVRIPK
jgi:hypothetical protein